MSSSPLRHADYTIAWIAILPIEVEAALGALDQRHHGHFESVRGDDYTYIGGEINGHNVVIAKLPAGQSYGVGAAAALVNQVKARFENIWFALLVGVAAGLPNLSTTNADRHRDIRLGDVLVCVPDKSSTGVIHYDLGRDTEKGFETIGRQAEPPALIRSAIGDIQLIEKPFRAGHELALLFEEFTKSVNNDKFNHPGQDEDELFEPPTDDEFSPLPCKTIRRERRDNLELTCVWYGRIGSGSTLMRNAQRRDELRDRYDLIGLEMEAAGVINTVPTSVVRGVCDYGDGHKTKRWQPYAAAVAAVYARAILLEIRPKLLLPTNDVMPHRAKVQSFKFSLDFSEAPVIEDEFFIGRSTDLREMENILQPQSVRFKHRRLVLGGIGGIGKTQLAIAYAKRYHHLYDSVFWLNAASEVVLKYSIRRMGQQVLNVEEFRRLGDDDQLLHYITRWLLDVENPRWLLVFDNYDEPDTYDINKYCPYGAHGSAIITTRLPDQVRGQQLLIRPLEDIKQSLDILATRSKRAYVDTDADALRLVQRVQGLPLALATVGAYLKHSSWTFEEYLQMYEKQFNVDNHRSYSLPEYRDRTLYTTWDLTYVRLEADHPQAAWLLRSLAFFNNQHLRYEMFRPSNNHSRARKLAKKVGWFGSRFRAPAEHSLERLSRITLDEFESAMRVLTEYCLVEMQSTYKTYSIHSCIHDWALSSLDVSSRKAGYWFAFDRIADLIADIAVDRYAYAEYSAINPHAVRLADPSFSAISQNASRKRLRIMNAIADFLREQFQLDAAKQMYLRVLAGEEAALGTEHTSTLSTVSDLGGLYTKQGKLVEAERMYKRALAGQEKALGAEHVSTLRTVNDLGLLFTKQGKLVEAEQMYTRALAGYKKRSGPEDFSTLVTVNNLGGLYRDQGRLTEAEQMYLQALAGKEKVLGPEHTSTITTVHHLGYLYAKQGKLVEAEQMYLRALAGYEKTVGPEHVSTLTTVNNLGGVYRDQDRLIEAERMYLRALAGKEKVLGREHASTLTTVSHLGHLYAKQGKLEEAEQMYLRALPGKEKTSGPEDMSTLTTVGNASGLHSYQDMLKNFDRHSLIDTVKD